MATVSRPRHRREVQRESIVTDETEQVAKVIDFPKQPKAEQVEPPKGEIHWTDETKTDVKFVPAED